MPQDDPRVGEVWSLLTPTSNVGEPALIVSRRDGVMVLYARNGRRVVVPERSFLLTWQFRRGALLPSPCAVTPCANPAWFYLRDGSSTTPVCWAHLSGPLIGDPEFLAADTIVTSRCPACRTAHFPGSGSSTVDQWEVHSCGHCRRDWVRLVPENTPEGWVTLAESIQAVADILEGRGLAAMAHLNIAAMEMVRKAVGSLGNPPSLAGIPLLASQDDSFVHVVGYQPKELRRRESNLQPSDTPNLAEPPTGLVPGAVWWTKDCEEVHILMVDQTVKFRVAGVADVLEREDFLSKYMQTPIPPATVGEEWRDTSGIEVTVKQLLKSSAIVEAKNGMTYLLPYSAFPRWTRIDRKTLYERLLDG